MKCSRGTHFMGRLARKQRERSKKKVHTQPGNKHEGIMKNVRGVLHEEGYLFRHVTKDSPRGARNALVAIAENVTSL
jgi:hypothetical protein